MKETKAVNQEAVFEKLPVPSALRVMVVPAVVSQLIVLIYNMGRHLLRGTDGKSLYGSRYFPDSADL